MNLPLQPSELALFALALPGRDSMGGVLAALAVRIALPERR